MSTDLAPQSPLMNPIDWQGQTYYTSQFFHRQYLANTSASATSKVKYKWHQDFVRLMKAIEAYETYCERGDIIELQWIAKRQQGSHEPAYLQQLKDLEALFRLVGFQTLYLLNATAQVALSHHLDDELSQQMSVAANTTVARQLARKSVGTSTPVELASRDIVAWLAAAQSFGTPLHIAQQEGVKMIASTRGVDFRPLLTAAPAQDDIKPDEEMLEPNDLAKRLGLPSGAYVNQALEHIGWQLKEINGTWQPTPVGTHHAARHAWTRKDNGKSGYNWKWGCTAVEQIFHAHGILPLAPPTQDAR